MTDSIDTFGWDTVFGIHYDYLNKTLQKTNAKLPDFTKWADVEAGVEISGSWSYFQVATGGSGPNLQLLCKLNSGTTSSGGDFTDSWLKIQVNLANIPNPDYPAKDKTGSGGTVQTMKVNATGTATSPAVAIISSDFPKVDSGLFKGALPVIFQRYFIANIAHFNQVFAAVLLDVTAATDKYQWLKPSYTSYACVDAGGGQLDQGVFAVLSKTDKEDPTGLSQQVDNRILQSLPDGSNSALAISAQKVLKHVFMQAAVFTIPGSKSEDFEINNDNLWIVNKNDVTWGNFTLDNGQTLTPVIKAHNFQLGLVGQTLQLQIIDATAKWTGWTGPGEIDLHMNITQQFEFKLQQKANGEFVLVPKPEKEGTSVKQITSTVTVSKEVTIFEVCMGIVLSFVGAVLGGPMEELFEAEGSIVLESVSEAVIKITEECIMLIIAEMGEIAIEKAEEAAAESASHAVKHVSDPAFTTEFKNAIAANKWKVFGGAMQGLLTVPAEMIPDLMTLVGQGDLEKVPAFNGFVDSGIGATTFPGSNGWDLKSAGLNGPMVITGNFKSAEG